MKSPVSSRNRKRFPPAIPGALILFPSALCFFSARWFVSIYGRIGFDAVLYTLSSSLGGVSGSPVKRWANISLRPRPEKAPWLFACYWR